MKNDMDGAISNYKKSLLNSKVDRPDCLYNLGNAFCMKGLYEDAKNAFAKCVEID
jgi:tetratricopeptide (TPR) repeat protein